MQFTMGQLPDDVEGSAVDVVASVLVDFVVVVGCFNVVVVVVGVDDLVDISGGFDRNKKQALVKSAVIKAT